MALSTRELYLALRVRDEGTRNLQRFASELTRTGTAARIASIRAQADALREQAALKRNEVSLRRVELARLRENDASRAQIRGQTSRIAELQKEAAELENNAKALDRQATAVQRSSDKLNHFTGTLTQTGIALQTLGVGLSFVGFAGFAAMNELVDVAVEYERQVAATSTQIDNFGGNMTELGDIGRRVAAKFAVPFEQIQPALFDIFSSMEIDVLGAEYLLEQFAKAAVAGQVDIQAASRATIGIMNAFAIPVEDVNRLLDLQFQLVQEGIGSYEEWTNRIGSVSPSAVRANQSIETMLAALAATTRFGIPAAMSATAVARAFDAMSNPAAIERMEELGINVRDAEGNILPFVDIMGEFRDILRSMPAEDRVETILDVFRGAGSTIQARKFLQSILLGEQGLETFQLILAEMTGDTGAFENAYATMADTVAMKSMIVENKWMLVKESIGQHLLPVFETFLGFLERLFDWFDKLPAGTKRTISQFILWGSILAVVFGVILVGLGLLAVFIASITATASVLGMVVGIVAAVSVALGLAIAFFVTLWTQSESFRESVKAGFEDFKEWGRIVLDVVKGIWGAFVEFVLPPLQRLWALVEEKVIPAFNRFRTEVWDKLKPKLEEAGRIIISIARKGLEYVGWLIDNVVVPAIQWLTEWWEKNKGKLEPLINVLGHFVKWLLIIVAVIIGVLVIAFVGPLVAAIAVVIAAFVLVIQVIGWLVDAIVAVWEFLKWLWGKITDFFKGQDVHLRNIGNNLKTFFTVTVPQFFHNVGDWLYGFGRMFIAGFINGMGSMFSEGVRAIGNWGTSLANALGNALGIHSPSRVMMELGTESALGYIIGFQQAMTAGLNLPGAAFLGLGTQDFAPERDSRPVGGGDYRGALMNANEPKKVVNNYITVNTQQLDPRAQAAQLGWELAGRM